MASRGYVRVAARIKTIVIMLVLVLVNILLMMGRTESALLVLYLYTSVNGSRKQQEKRIIMTSLQHHQLKDQVRIFTSYGVHVVEA